MLGLVGPRQPLEALFAESLALEAGAGDSLDRSWWAAETKPAAPSSLPDTLPSIAAALFEPGCQLALLLPPQDRRAPSAAILPAIRPPLPGTMMTARHGPLVSDAVGTTSPGPPLPPKAAKRGAFAPSRRRKTLAKDQLRLFG